MAIRRVVFDIETVGAEWGSFTPEVQQLLIKRARGETDAEREANARDRLALSGLTGEAVLIGMINPDTRRGQILLRCPPERPELGASDIASACGEAARAVELASDGCVTVIPFADERKLLEQFWIYVRHAPRSHREGEREPKGWPRPFEQVVSYNGRTFDGPFLMQRSLLLGIPALRNLCGNRYRDDHIDLMDRMTYFGLSDRFGPSLDLLARRLGIPSPKEQMSGVDVEPFWRTGALDRVCTYSLGDIETTAAVFQRYVETHGHLYDLDEIRDENSGASGAMAPAVPASNAAASAPDE